MSVTAARLGSAPITVDWTALTAVSAPAGAPLSSDRTTFAPTWQALQHRFDRGEAGYHRAPGDPILNHAAEARALAEKIRGSGSFTDCLFLGIGGSALGPKSLLEALRHKASPGIRFHFQENPDPVDWKHTLSFLLPAHTLVCAVTKSGTTFETLAQLLIALEWLGRERWASHLVCITDPEKGDLREFARQHGLQSLPIAPAMGGRFSVFTPVGLFPAALAGLSIDDFLRGAAQVRDHLDKGPHEKNPLFVLGHEFIRHFPKRPIHVFMPYSTPLRGFGAWFSQLWGESLGKDGKGFTPVAALGATDQHGLLQLLRDGPDDKITWFVTVDSIDDDVAIPKRPAGLDSSNLPALAQLEGNSLSALLRIEYQATSLVLTRRGRPHLTFRMDRLDERSLGALTFAFCSLTAVTGALWNVNPFDQPGVEESKVLIRESLRAARSQPEEIDWDDPQDPVARLRRDRERGD